ncbi:5'-3' exoribonuclease 1 isoform X1 [Euwallacea fornicatus]|uniref:5'-3' exoribonuclease 1 isoform X1 n=1 Tax=Euwallacea fornicatus TaxID=995702 RepID=UPI00338DD954
MGVPKFFRYISERYPCLSEVVREYQIPEFDNMYLDMNGIIHLCSHPDDHNPHFRITEEKIFQDIFHYIEVLFRLIKPRKLFFMAIDGVAPRAKMNQQRGRRFRSAKDAEKQEAEARKKGEILPTEARFDSNCITPGTVFMARLHQELKHFCVDKISNDPIWKDVKIILSGHETPGEGEHKIMDYIRYLRSQPGYDPNTRHCLYGLDADLIMLGLCSHEPHFSLLREEVKFGKKSSKHQSVPEEITFFLLHLSLMREYLELEFASLKEKLVTFKFDLEKIIDDWVLMGFLVGNDFIPHLPHLHIASGALPILYMTYKEVLPTLDGYINEGGDLNLPRFEKFMQQLATFDFDTFEEIRDDLMFMEAKTGRKMNTHSKVSMGVKKLEEWSNEIGDLDESLEPEEDTPARDSGLEALIRAAADLDIPSDEDDGEDDDDKAFTNYKKDYYMNKLEYAKVTPEVLRAQAEGYVRAIQWNLNYYYNGCCSWSWFYPHHYAPYISDIKGFSDLKLEFNLGSPFKPYEQLLAVLPAASKTLLPTAYHELMTSEESPLKSYYPENFQTDKNGKRQEWEAVVLIPFMDEKSLLEAMQECNERLTPEERKRNRHGPMLAYTRSSRDLGIYEGSHLCPTIKHNYSLVEEFTIEDIRVPKEKLFKGLYPGVALDVYFPGFPTMKHLKYKPELKKARVKVFEQASRSENMILHIIEDDKEQDTEKSDVIPWELVGANVFVAWPHLVEARIVSIQNKNIRYVSMGESNQYNTEELKNGKAILKDESRAIVEHYATRLGVDVGPVEMLCKVQVMIGRKYVFAPNGRLTLEKQFSEITANYPLQTIVSKIDTFDSHHTIQRNIQELFAVGEICFVLGNPHYGSQGIVTENKDVTKTGRIFLAVVIAEEPNFDSVLQIKENLIRGYKTLFRAASSFGMSHYVYARITGSIFVEVPDGSGGFKNSNIGLDLKFNKRNQEMPGYTKRIDITWYYTEQCSQLVGEYAEKFPEVFQYLADHGSNDNIRAENMFPESDWEEKMAALQEWLATLPTHSIEKQQCGSQKTERAVVEEIERVVDEYTRTPKGKTVVMKVRPSSLYKPDLQSGSLPPDPKVQTEIFDRIINTRKGFTVPFGLKGTVIAITESASNNPRDTLYDVVFDKSFKDGMELNCSPERGYKLPSTAFINISYGKRLYNEKAGNGGRVEQETPWVNINFNVAAPNVQSRRGIPDQYSYYPQKNRKKQLKPGEGSAFAQFTSQMKNQPNSSEKPRERTKINEQISPIKPAQPEVLVFNNKEAVDNPKENEKPLVNTNFLKNLLKLNENHTKQEAAAHSPNVPFEVLAQKVANTPASIRLLTYYQSNGLGVPRYEHFKTGDKYKAQVSLTNGQLVMGEPAENKEEATENVASVILGLLMKKGPQSNNGSVLPEPPKTWVETPKEKDQALKVALQNPFVPTQVMKRQSSKNSEERKISETEKQPAPAMGQAPQQRKPRTSRIAANFNKKI